VNLGRPGATQGGGAGGDGGATRDYVVDHENAQSDATGAPDREGRAVEATLGTRPTCLSRAGDPLQQAAAGAPEPAGDALCEQLGLIEAPVPAPAGRRRRPGDDVDMAGINERRHGFDQGRQHRSGVAVLETSHHFARHAFVGEQGRATVDPGGTGQNRWPP